MDLVSTSSSPEFCKICRGKAHGNHFGVASCRACAVFFRRTAGSKWSKLPCRCRNDQICKPCRLKRCREMGMDSTKFQYSRDAFTMPSEFRLPQSLESYVGRPGFLLFCTSESSSDTPKVLIDVRHLLDEASRLLNQGPPLIYEKKDSHNQLKKFSLGFKNHIEFDVEKLKKGDISGKLEMMAMWEFYFLTVTKWIMYFDEFHKLNRHLQMTLLQTIWHVWGKLHKVVCTSIYRKLNRTARKTEYIYNDTILDSENIKKDYSWMSDYPTEKVSKFLDAYVCVKYDPIQLLIDMAPSDVEFTFMFAQLCFEYAGKRYQGDMLKVTERFQEILANDLHEYYSNDLQVPRYFHRMAKLMKVNNTIQKFIFESRPKMELGRVFNVLKLEFSHPEMFEDSGFY